MPQRSPAGGHALRQVGRIASVAAFVLIALVVGLRAAWAGHPTIASGLVAAAALTVTTGQAARQRSGAGVSGIPRAKALHRRLGWTSAALVAGHLGLVFGTDSIGLTWAGSDHLPWPARIPTTTAVALGVLSASTLAGHRSRTSPALRRALHVFLGATVAAGLLLHLIWRTQATGDLASSCFLLICGVVIVASLARVGLRCAMSGREAAQVDRTRAGGPQDLGDDEYHQGSLLLVAAQRGIMPAMSILRTQAARRDPRPHCLVWASPAGRDARLRRELRLLRTRLDLDVVKVGRRPGRPDPQLLADLLDRRSGLTAPRAYVFGPEPVLTDVNAALLEAGLPARRIHVEQHAHV